METGFGRSVEHGSLHYCIDILEVTGLFAILILAILFLRIRIAIIIIIYFLHLKFPCLIRNILQFHAARHSHTEG